MAADAERAVSEVFHGAQGAKGAAVSAESGASCLLHSFVAGTRVLLADGSTKPIEQVHDGDEVQTTDPSTGTVESHKVVGTLVHRDEQERTEITLDSGATLVATDWHPVWVEEVGDWAAIGSLTAGEHLRAADGQSAEVVNVRQFTQQAPVYDLTVDSVHDYFVVAGSVPVLVHNCGSAAGDRAAELQAALPGGSQGRVTMGVGHGVDGNGVARTVVGTSEPGGYLRPGVRNLVDHATEEVATGAGHAEVSILNHMAENGITPTVIAVGRPICPSCARAIWAAGAVGGSVLK